MKPLDVLQLYPPHDNTLSGLLESRCSHQPEAECVLFEKTRVHTWQSFFALVAGLGRWLGEHAVGVGDRVAVVSPNSDLVVALFFALNDLGAIFVPVNPELKADELAYIFEHAKPKLVLVAPDRASALSAANPARLRIVELVPALLQKSESKLKRRGRPTSTGLILYTSGTTGFPKGVMHSQASAVLAGEAFVERMHLVPSDRVLCILPFFHINALFYSLMGSFAAGAALIVVPRFSASRFWELVRDSRATQVNIIAAVGNILAQRDRGEFRPGHALQKIYGAPVSPQIEKTFREEFGVAHVIEGYGMTEIPGAINNQISGRQKIGTMGLAAQHPDRSIKFTELKIVDDSGAEVNAGATGELLVKTPLLMQGYFNDPQQTRDAYDEAGWFKTGDYVCRDAEGFYVFVARKKDIVRRRGENISGAEIDRVLGTCPGVVEAATIGVPSPLGEEDILAAVVVGGAPPPDARRIRTWCETHLSRIKWPRYIVIVDALPHTPTARVAKFKLKGDTDLLARATDFDKIV